MKVFQGINIGCILGPIKPWRRRQNWKAWPRLKQIAWVKTSNLHLRVSRTVHPSESNKRILPTVINQFKELQVFCLPFFPRNRRKWKSKSSKYTRTNTLPTARQKATELITWLLGQTPTRGRIVCFVSFSSVGRRNNWTWDPVKRYTDIPYYRNITRHFNNANKIDA